MRKSCSNQAVERLARYRSRSGNLYIVFAGSPVYNVTPPPSRGAAVNLPIPHFASRLFSLTAFVVVGGLIVGSGLSRSVPSRTLLGLSVVFMGIFAFLQPLLLEIPLRSLTSTSPALTLGSRAVATCRSGTTRIRRRLRPCSPKRAGSGGSSPGTWRWSRLTA